MYKRVLHRNAQKRFYIPSATYLITTNTYNRYPFFQNTLLCDFLIEKLRICKKLKKFELYAFCILFDHMHLLLRPSIFNISQIMFSLKRQFSYGVSREDVDIFREGEQCIVRLRGKPRIWQKSFHDHRVRNRKDLKNHHNYVRFNFLNHGYALDWKYTSLNYPDLIAKI